MTTTQTDPRPLLLAAAAQVTPLIDGVRPADLDRPTPCDGWAVRDLLAHLAAVASRVPYLLRGGHPFDVPSMVEGVADDGWAAAWAERQPDLAASLAEDGVLDRTVHHPAGELPAAGAMLAYTSELAAHGWDLAAALGRTTDLDDEVAAACLEPTRRFLPAEIRHLDEVPFGPVVEVDDDASSYQRLLGWYGRDPHWTAPAAH
ncbi:TIGR03086 family metal-binding protein [Nocardioides sp. C4-1]|uniref:TIGR03086 family metal-binding protein n=1 Tax=Nocardioides sp. C4-1 TaxID=3151851 RepID=UPI0032632239